MKCNSYPLQYACPRPLTRSATKTRHIKSLLQYTCPRPLTRSAIKTCHTRSLPTVSKIYTYIYNMWKGSKASMKRSHQEDSFRLDKHLWKCRSHYHFTKIEGSEIPLRSRSSWPEQVWVVNSLYSILEYSITLPISSFFLLFLLLFSFLFLTNQGIRDHGKQQKKSTIS